MLVFAMCQIAASGLKLFQNCIMNQKCIVYNDWNFCTRFKKSNIWWQPQTVIPLSGELMVVHAGICLGPKSINSWYKQRHSVCVNIVGGGGPIDWESNSQGTCYSSSTHSVMVILSLICFDTFLFKNSCFPELSLSIYGHVIQEM